MKFLPLIITLFLINLGYSQNTAPVFGWAKSIGEVDHPARKMVTDRNGNIYIVGSFKDTVDFNPNSPTNELIAKTGYNIFIQKLDTSGNLLWVKHLESSNQSSVYSLNIDSRGNLVLIGTFSDTLDVDPDSSKVNIVGNPNGAFVLSLDSIGKFNWVTEYSGNFKIQAGTLDSHDNIYFGGSFIDSVDLDPSITSYDVFYSQWYWHSFVTKLNSQGDYEWALPFKPNNLQYGAGINGLLVDKDSSIFIVGSFIDTFDFDLGNGVAFDYTLNPSTYILKLNGIGQFQWLKKFEQNNTTASDALNYPTAVTNDGHGNFYIAGRFRDSVDFDPDTNNTSWIYSSGPGTSGLYYGLFISKFNSDGILLWVKASTPNNDSWITDLASNNDGLYLSGWFKHRSEFFTNPRNHIYVTPFGGFDIFLQKLDIAGNYLWVHHIGSKTNSQIRVDQPFSICLDYKNNIYLTGNFEDTAQFSLDSSKQIVSKSKVDMLIHQIQQRNLITSIKEHTKDEEFILFPNPTSGILTIDKGVKSEVSLFVIYDARGIKVYSTELIQDRHQIDLNFLSNGLYIVISDNTVKKLLIHK